MTIRRFLAAGAGLLALSLVPAQPAFSQSRAAAPTSSMKALPASAQEQISAVLGREQHAYQAAVRAGGFELDNPQHRLAAEFTGTGVRLKAGTGDWGLTLRGYGYGDKLIAGGVVPPQATANRVEYRRGALTEWYVNGPLGLEQGFNVARAPGKSRGKR